MIHLVPLSWMWAPPASGRAKVSGVTIDVSLETTMCGQSQDAWNWREDLYYYTLKGADPKDVCPACWVLWKLQ